MPKSFQTLAYVLPVLAVLAFLLSWKFFISPDPVETSPDHQARLSATAANVFAPAETSEDELRVYAVYIVRKVPFRESIYWLWHLPWPREPYSRLRMSSGAGPPIPVFASLLRVKTFPPK